jgi:hypothetical protein
MPNTNRVISSTERHLISVLKDYWTYHKHCYADRLQSFVETYFGAQAYLEDLRDWYFKDQNYYSKLALNIATAVCTNSDRWWDLLLVRHGYNKSKGRDTSFYIYSIIIDLKELNRRSALQPTHTQYVNYEELPPKLQLAMDTVAEPRYARVLDVRLEQLRVALQKPLEEPVFEPRP